jgi:hypothetical protein
MPRERSGTNGTRYFCIYSIQKRTETSCLFPFFKHGCHGTFCDDIFLWLLFFISFPITYFYVAFPHSRRSVASVRWNTHKTLQGQAFLRATETLHDTRHAARSSTLSLLYLHCEEQGMIFFFSYLAFPIDLYLSLIPPFFKKKTQILIPPIMGLVRH